VVSVTHRPRLTPGTGPPVPIVQEAGWTPEPVWTQRLEEKSFTPRRESNPDRPVVQPVVRHYTAWASRLLMLLSSCGRKSSVILSLLVYRRFGSWAILSLCCGWRYNAVLLTLRWAICPYGSHGTPGLGLLTGVATNTFANSLQHTARLEFGAFKPHVCIWCLYT
jgi:hypothetical protein